MHIGITIKQNDPLEYSGARQTAEVLCHLFRYMGHTACTVDLAYSRPLNNPLDLLIDMDASGAASDRARWSRRSIAFLRGVLSFAELDSIVYMEDSYVSRDLTDITEVWCWEELNPAETLDALATLFPCPIRRVPMVWAPPFPALAERILAPPPLSALSAPTLHVMEKNKNNTSTSVLAIVALRELARTNSMPASTRIRIHNMEHLRDNRFLKENVLDNVEWSTAMAPYQPEFTTERSSFTAWPEGSILLSHTRFSPLRWHLLSVLWAGIPILHNSPILRDLHPQLAAMYYRGNEITGAQESILSVWKAHLAQPDRWYAARQSVREAIQARWGLSARAEEWKTILGGSSVPAVPVLPALPALPASPMFATLPQTLRIAFINMWPGFSPTRNYFIDAFRQHLPSTTVTGSLYSPTAPKPDFLLFGSFGEDWKQVPSEIPRVHFSAENWSLPSDPSIRLFLTSSRQEDATHFRIPTWAIFVDWYSKKTALPSDPEELESNPIRLPLHFATTTHPVPFTKRNQFCGFVVSNAVCGLRNETFHALNAYKPVHSGGALFNNIGGQLSLKYPGGGCGDLSKHAFFADHQFAISFENSQAPGYITEKLLHAKMAGCLPLYWGDQAIEGDLDDSDFAPQSFMNLSKVITAEQVVEVVKRLESRPDICEKMASIPLLSQEKVEKALGVQAEMVRRLMALLPTSSVPVPAPTPAPTLSKIGRVYLVNLDKRQDRLEQLMTAEPYWKTYPAWERVSAVDGKTLALTPFLCSLFKNNNFEWKKSVMGCLLSHLRIWTSFLQTAHEYALILEDDVRFVPDWRSRWETMAKEIPSDAEVLYLGGVLPQNKAALPLASESVNGSWQRVLPNRFFTPDTPTPIFHFCTFSYVLHRRGAQKLMDFLMKSDLKAFTACDHLLGHPILGLTHYHASPLLTTCFQEEDPVYQQSNFNELLRKDQFDSDIWNNTECFTEEERQACISVTPPTQVHAPSMSSVSPLKIYVLEEMPELYERAWLEDMLQHPIQLCTVETCPPHTPSSLVPWFLIQRPHLDKWNNLFAEYEKQERPFAVLHLSDEFAADDISFYRYRMCKGVIRNYHRDDCPERPHILVIPLGYHHKPAKEDAQKPIQARELLWSFHGTDWFQRSEQLRPMMEFVPNSCRLQPTWNHPSATKEKQYLSTLTNSKCCPILRGNNRETFRMYEVLEAGAIPITNITDLNYLYQIDKELQLEDLYAWNRPMELLQKPDRLTEDLRQEILRRWNQWKVRIQTECARILYNAK